MSVAELIQLCTVAIKQYWSSKFFVKVTLKRSRVDPPKSQSLQNSQEAFKKTFFWINIPQIFYTVNEKNKDKTPDRMWSRKTATWVTLVNDPLKKPHQQSPCIFPSFKSRENRDWSQLGPDLTHFQPLTTPKHTHTKKNHPRPLH